MEIVFINNNKRKEEKTSSARRLRFHCLERVRIDFKPITNASEIGHFFIRFWYRRRCRANFDNTDIRRREQGFARVFGQSTYLAFCCIWFPLFGPTSSIWYSSLDTYVFPDAPTSGLAVASKVLADQILWAPVLISCLFAFDLAFDASETKKPSLSKKIENDLLSALKVNWSFWPLFHLFSFRYVSTEDRILYINCVQIAFNVFLVYTSSRREEEKEEPKNQNRGS